MQRIHALTASILDRTPAAVPLLLDSVQALLPSAFRVLLAGSSSAQFIRPGVHADDVDVFVLAPSMDDQRAAMHDGREVIGLCKSGLRHLTPDQHPDAVEINERLSSLTAPLIALRLNRPGTFRLLVQVLHDAFRDASDPALLRPALHLAEQVAVDADATADAVEGLLALGFTEHLPDADPQRAAELYQAFRVLRLGKLHVIFTQRTSVNDLLANFDIPQHRSAHVPSGTGVDVVDYTSDSWMDLTWTAERHLNVYRDSRVWRVEKAVERGYHVDPEVLEAAEFARSIGQDRLSFARGDTPDRACVLVRSDHPAYALGYRCFGAEQFLADDQDVA